MSKLQIIFWRDIPAQIIASEGREKVRRQLEPRFEAAIDLAAMRAGLRGTDDYLNQWRRTAPTPCEHDLELAAENARTILESTYTSERLDRLVRDLGVEEPEVTEAVEATDIREAVAQ
jgi:hypothetical protein